MDASEDARPTTSLSQEFMERASPFTIADGDGHSSIASPVLSAVASEWVVQAHAPHNLYYFIGMETKNLTKIYNLLTKYFSTLHWI